MIFSHLVKEIQDSLQFWIARRGFRIPTVSGISFPNSGIWDPDVTTVFTYSYANTPLGQSERAYYLYKYIMDSDGMTVAKALAHLICDKALA